MSQIYILTHPCAGNYGGMLQAYALQTTIKKISTKNVLIIDYSPKRKIGIKYIISSILSTALLHIGCKWAYTHATQYLKNARLFKSKFLKLQNINTHIQKSKKNATIVVGSDQVWRGAYANQMLGLPFYFLEYTTSRTRMKSISYSASFGTNAWEGSEEETKLCRLLLQDFKAVSVREHSGIKICKDVFDVPAVQMPDPTLLLYTNDYNFIINSDTTWIPTEKYIALYLLGKSSDKLQLINNSASLLNLKHQDLTPNPKAKLHRNRFPHTVSQWLRLIRECEYFITDSFHGCVFAIIFNKLFVCIDCENRGTARFDTLLGTFGLESRLITDATPEKIQQVLQTPIDWEKVNAIHDAERERGIKFLKENLSE